MPECFFTSCRRDTGNARLGVTATGRGWFAVSAQGGGVVARALLEFWSIRRGLRTFATAGTLVTGGCAARDASLGAPALPLFNAFFPAWLLCAFCGVIGAVLVRFLFIRIGLDDVLPVRLPVYVALTVIIGLLVSQFGFGR